jgi:chemotaxis signal transduction protein
MLGIFQVGNRRLPVLDIRGFMNLPVRSPALDDILIEVVSRGSRFAFPADGLVGTCSFVPEELRECTAVCPGMAGYVNQVAEFEGRTVWIYTLERLFVSHDFPGILVRCRDAVQQADEEVVE